MKKFILSLFFGLFLVAIQMAQSSFKEFVSEKIKSIIVEQSRISEHHGEIKSIKTIDKNIRLCVKIVLLFKLYFAKISILKIAIKAVKWQLLKQSLKS